MNYDRIILELLNRVSKLEEIVTDLKSSMISENEFSSEGPAETDDIDLADSEQATAGRDTTKYLFDGKRYGKNRLVLAIVEKYVSLNRGITAAKLMTVFDKHLQGSLGVVRTIDDVKKSYMDYERRFFCQPDEIIHTATEDCAVCTQWGKFNIENIIARAKELGIDVTAI